MAAVVSDIVISGGGATGLALALGILQNTDLSVTVIDPAKPGEVSEGFDARSVALAAHSVKLLEHLGVEALNAISCPIDTIHVSDQGHLGQCVLRKDEFDVPALGRVVELQALGKALDNALSNFPPQRLTRQFGDALTDIEQHASHLQLQTRTGQQWQTRLLCIAEGGRSPSRDMLGIGATFQPYEQVAVIANVALDRHHQNLACERFTANGPLAMLPMTAVSGDNQPSRRCSLVWTTNAEQAEALVALSDADFVGALQQAFGYRLGNIIGCGERNAYPLALIRANATVGHRTALLGNAAQSLHPIAGQGLNLALRDVEDLLAVIGRVSSQDLHEVFSLLQQYNTARQRDKSRVVGLTDTLVRVFSNQFLPFVIGRNLGLFAMQHMQPLKARFTAQAMGLRP